MIPNLVLFPVLAWLATKVIGVGIIFAVPRFRKKTLEILKNHRRKLEDWQEKRRGKKRAKHID